MTENNINSNPRLMSNSKSNRDLNITNDNSSKTPRK